MKVLLVTGFFPPHAPLAATRAPALARFLRDRGHGVKVLGARNPDFPPVLDHGLAAGDVTFAEVDPPLPARGLLRDLAPLDGAALARLARPLRTAAAVAGWPDQRIGWLPHAEAAADRLMADWRPDVMIASVPPHSGLLLARRIHRRHGIPWVADLRDLWTGHPYYDGRGLVRLLDRAAERAALATAAGLVTVTEGWRAALAVEWSGKPVRLVRNGFEDDAADTPAPPPPADGPLTIVYAGVLYGHKRDPRPLFAAVRQLGLGPEDVRIRFYGSEPDLVQAHMAEHGLTPPLVEVLPPVRRAELMPLQRAADVLLLLRWNDPRENAVLAGKLFEYIGCRRPILSVGLTTGEAADIIRAGDLGLIADDPTVIAAHLRALIDTKRRLGQVPPPPGGAAGA
ncbi:glycosyltransferase, partial [Caenispirillum bisanense]|uniref:glycosyltransferase n=1 Tax=Caenispirillum bisanense TaxID=414052 RepID=UPI0031D9B95B